MSTFAPEEDRSAPRTVGPDYTSRTDTLVENPPTRRDPVFWIWIGGFVVAAMVDIPLAIPAFNHVLRESPFLSLLCAVGFALLTLLAAFSSGREAKRANMTGAIVAGVAVCALVAGLFTLRILAAQTEAAVALSGFDGATGEAGSGNSETPIAFVMAAFMVATAILASIEGYVLTETRLAVALRKTGRAIALHDTQIEVLEAQETRHLEDIPAKVSDLAGIDAGLDVARQGLDAFALELHELARVEYARHLGDPVATSNLDKPLAHGAAAFPAEGASIGDTETNTDPSTWSHSR